MKLVIIFLCSFLCISYCFSQDKTIVGTVQDSTEQKALYLANVTLHDSKDSLYKATVTSEQGRFELTKIEKGTYSLKISFVGFKSVEQKITVDSESVDIGSVFLAEDLTQLDEVSVEGQAPAVVLKQDTVEFNSSAYKTTSEANLEELLKKMPGLEIKDGKVTTQGEAITKIIVDGKPFFSSSPDYILKNLPADMVSKVQVIDEKSKEAIFSGHDDGKREKVINVVTKPEKRRGYFANVSLTYSPPERYQVSGNVNFLHGKDRFSLSGGYNNLGGGSSQRVAVSPSGETISLGGPSGGISNTKNFGTSYFSDITTKLTASISYNFRGTDSQLLNEISQQYIQEADSGRVYNQRSETTSTNRSHSTSLNLEYKMSDNNHFGIRQSFSFNNSQRLSQVNGNTLINGNEINSTDNKTFSKSNGENWNTALSWRHKFAKKGRTLSVETTLSQSESTGVDTVRSVNNFSSGDISNQDFNQLTTPIGSTENLSGRVSYTEPLGEKKSLRLSYRKSYSNNAEERLLLDYNNEKEIYDQLDSVRSSQYENIQIKDDFTSSLRFSIGEVNLVSGLEYQRQRIQNDQVLPNATAFDSRFQGILPSLSVTTKTKSEAQLRFRYNRNMSIPRASQLQDVLDNTNPLFLRRGNPDLNQSYSNSGSLSYLKFNKESKSYISFSLSGSISENDIVNSTIIGNGQNSPEGISLPIGARLSTPVNVNGRKRISGGINLSKPIEKLKLNFQVNGSVSLSQNPQFLNGTLQSSKNKNYALGLSLNSNFSKKLDFSIATQPSISNVSNGSSEIDDRRFFQIASTARLTYKSESGFTLPHHSVIKRMEMLGISKESAKWFGIYPLESLS